MRDCLHAADMDVAKLLQTGTSQVYKDLLQLLSTTSDACQAALAKATSAAEPQGLIQAYARLQQLQGRAVAVPSGAPASMAVTSKVLGLIEALSAVAAGTTSAGVAGTAGAAGGAAIGATGVKPTSAVKPGDKVANAIATNTAEQVRTQVGSRSYSSAVLNQGLQA